MSLVIAREPPDRADIGPLLAASEAVSAALYPPESNHMIGLETLLGPDVSFFVARLAARPIGCAALVRASAHYGELKRMFVAENARGTGIAHALLDAVERDARARGIGLIRLETGIHSHAALALYRSAGFVERGAFGAYLPDALSVFMERRLHPQP